MSSTSIRQCQLCGCTENHACSNAIFPACWWVNENTCSHCVAANASLVKEIDRSRDVDCDMVSIPVHHAEQLLKMTTWLGDGMPAKLVDIRQAVAALQGRLEAFSP